MKMGKRTLLSLLLSILFIGSISADEGMWLINGIDQKLYGAMKAQGLKLTADQIFNVDKASLSDAVVAIDGGSCSGSIISEQGLMITNHHCAYRDIHTLSTPEKNYLEDGFWAFNRGDEMPIEGKSVTFLRGIVDVTDLSNRIIDSLDAAGPRGLFFMNRVANVIEEYFDHIPYEKYVTSEWRGSRYLLYIYETYNDVRLVGAPPSYIGSFGGEVDNWGWPQHKGDFALYRIYGDKDGKPAKYSEDNIPLKFDNYLTISSKGVKEGDFSMILGYPGRTNRYSSSFEANEKYSIENPISYKVRRAKLDVWKSHMERDDKVRLNYADKYFGTSNYTDYARWENLCIERFDVIEKMEEREVELANWIRADKERTEKYGTLLAQLEKAYSVQAEHVKNKLNFQESLARGADLIRLGQRFRGVARFMERHNRDSADLTFSRAREFMEYADKEYKTVDYEADKELFAVMLRYYVENVGEHFWDSKFKDLLTRFNRDYAAIADYIYSNSVVTDRGRAEEFFSKKRSMDDFLADPMIEIVDNISMLPYNRAISNAQKKAKVSLSKVRGDYVRALYEMREDKGVSQYPDANSTMRLTYGTVGGSTPKDAVQYSYFSTTKGILEKEDPEDYEFKIAPTLKEALERGDWGRWGEDGALSVNFMSNNDITGGNSGSAVLNGKGELIGLAFDGNRESMAGDIYYVAEYNKCVNVDIRYVLWVMDKYVGAQVLLDEMNIR